MASSLLCRWTSCLAVSLGVAIAANAQGPSADDVLHELDGGPIYRAYVYEGLHLRKMALESTRRWLLVQRCSALSSQYPLKPAPRLVEVSDVVWRWMVSGGVDGVSNIPSTVLVRDLEAAAINAAFLSDELQAWDRFRKSPQGRRGLEVQALRDGIASLDHVLIENGLGMAWWTWPIAKLRTMSDYLHLRSAFDGALNAVEDGLADEVGKLSDVPGNEVAGHTLPDLLAGNRKKLDEALVEQLTQNDRAALLALEEQAALVRWRQVRSQTRWFANIGPQASSNNSRQTVSAREFCDAGGLRCTAPQIEALENQRNALADHLASGADERAVREIVKRTPEAGCP
ncbi:hypothetical protein [Hylemonella gracilis]|uniref:hypothetical protein n=1 Tax=Hylemonella gracilis TaxID=80880 RepID=UPI0011105679|nr:hypothetical protein [Hylemonella gracilis]